MNLDQKSGISLLFTTSSIIDASISLVEAVVWVVTKTLLSLLTSYTKTLALEIDHERSCFDSPARLAFSLSNSSMPRVSASRSMKAPVKAALKIYIH